MEKQGSECTFISRCQRLGSGNYTLTPVPLDMFEAEYTHVGAACTFEVLLDAFDLRSTAGLSPIAEIVHDIDCKDEKFGRAETAPTARALDELYRTHASDAERLDHGAMLFENLFGLFGE